MPDRIVVSRYDQFWRLLGVVAEVGRLDEVIAQTRCFGHCLDWVARRPRRAIELAPVWPTILAATTWLASEAGRGRYLREVTAPGVDTKFIERHQGVLGELLDSLGQGVPQGVAAHPRSFAGRRGFREAERLVHLRLDPQLRCLPGGIDEVALPLRHAVLLEVEPERVLVIENQVTFLSVPLPRRGIVVWGHGFDAVRLGSLPWLSAAPQVRYWGDIDTHGFAILGVLRTRVPQLESILMDRVTLLAHEDRWGKEPTPTRADVPALRSAERRLYLDLIEGIPVPGLRLEQERIDWAHCLGALDDWPA